MLTTWDELRTGDANGPVMLTVDFEGGRAVAGFRALAKLLPQEWTVLAARPPERVPGDEEEASRALARWRDDITAGGVEVAGVLANCAGAPIAGYLAESLGGAASAPRLVLLDPAAASADVLVEAYRTALASLPAAPAEPVPAGVDLTDGLGEPLGLAVLARRLSRSYRDHAGGVAERLGVSQDLTADLARLFERYMAYLVVAGLAADRPQGRSHTLTITSSGFTLEEARDRGERIGTDVPRARLLADAGVATAISDFLVRPPIFLV
ncbi:hypothetical protein [Nonomuraea sp. B5E05]|uniref:hypothetical protein n=1 Tax=Nonomuraea sp. B5E05 TaxID=3153569 RepID=UPI0032609E13